ncbi:MAG: DUF1028 domain-containing protein [Thermoanaerobaculia bacterium]|nr:DUF1028 domain-containing protein [Thermoanaerobaculia bacterium]
MYLFATSLATLALLSGPWPPLPAPGLRLTPVVSTFSIVARDPSNGDLGVAVQSKFPNVRVAVPFAKAGVGAVATQSFANSDFGTKGLRLLELGATPQEVLAIIGRDDADLQDRQVGIVDARGRAATFTGKKCFDWAGGRTGPDYAIQGNILVSEATVDAMEKAFVATRASLAQRLLAAIKAGAEAGGDKRGRQSAALLVVREGASYDGKSDAYVDISVYDAPDPIAEIFRLYELQKIHFERSDPADVAVISGEDARYLQRLLSKKGFHKGRTDGVWDEASTAALADYMGWENYDTRIRRDGKIDRKILALIRGKEGDLR